MSLLRKRLLGNVRVVRSFGSDLFDRDVLIAPPALPTRGHAFVSKIHFSCLARADNTNGCDRVIVAINASLVKSHVNRCVEVLGMVVRKSLISMLVVVSLTGCTTAQIQGFVGCGLGGAAAGSGAVPGKGLSATCTESG